MEYLVIFGLFIMLIFYLYMQNNLLIKRHYKIHIERLHHTYKGKKIVFFSDTHLREKNSDRLFDQLIDHIKSENPDIILFGGDMIHASASHKAIEHAKDLFFQIGKVAPTYVVLGNHDIGNDYTDELRTALKIAGVTILENNAKWINLNKNGNGFWLMGYKEDFSRGNTSDNNLSKIKMTDYSKNEPKILIAHRPEQFDEYLENEHLRPNLILSGHTHGGQIILPIIGGLFAPGQGINPKYDFGMFIHSQYSNRRLLLTRGIGNSSFPFRINNRPEYIVIEFE